MGLSAAELAALRIALSNEEGRIGTYDPNNAPLMVMGAPGEDDLVLGKEGLRRLLGKGLIRHDCGDSYLITPAGRALVES